MENLIAELIAALLEKVFPVQEKSFMAGNDPDPIKRATEIIEAAAFAKGYQAAIDDAVALLETYRYRPVDINLGDHSWN